MNGSGDAGSQGQRTLGRIKPQGFGKLTGQGEYVDGVAEDQPAVVCEDELAPFPGEQAPTH